MKKFIKSIIVGIAVLGISFGVMAAGPIFGASQEFAGMTNTYFGYTFSDVLETNSLTAQVNVNDVFGFVDGPSFLVDSTVGFGFTYEYNKDAIDINLYTNALLNKDNDDFKEWNYGGRVEFTVPQFSGLKIFSEVGINGEYGVKPVLSGKVGFDVEL